MNNTVTLEIAYHPETSTFVVTVPNPDEVGGLPPYMGMVQAETRLAAMVTDAARDLFDLALKVRDRHLGVS